MPQQFSQIQHPAIKGEKPFQDFCLKLLRLEWQDSNAAIYGRSGQKQHGVDILGSDKRNNFPVAGCQCKASEKNHQRPLTIRELEAEVNQAKKFTPKLNLLIVAYSGERDTHLASRAAELNLESKAKGLFEIALWSWDDILERAEAYPEMRAEALIADGYLKITLALDPKRPANPLLDTPATISTVSTGSISLAGDVATANASTADLVHETKIDIWRDQIRAGQAATIIGPLESFIRSLDSSASAHVRFRAYANLGAAFEQEHRNTEAAQAFEKAADAEPGAAASYAYKSRALLLKGEREEAFREAEAALALDPVQQLAAVQYLQTAPDGVTAAAMEDRFVSLLDEPDIGVFLAARFSDEGKHEDAIRIARGIEGDGSGIERDTAIALANLISVQDKLSVRLGTQLPSEDEERLQEARRLLEGSLVKVRQGSNRFTIAYMAANLVTAYRFTGENEKADDLAIEALGFAPDDPAILERASVAYVHRRNLDEAFDVAKRIAMVSPQRGSLLVGDVASMAGRWSDLAEWGQKAFDVAADDDDRAHSAEQIVLASSRTVGPRAALEQAAKLRDTFAPSVAFEARVAEVARLSGNASAVEAAKQRLSKFDVSSLDLLQRFELSSAYADMGDWKRAADLLDGLYRPDRPSTPLRQKLFYLYRADLRAEARELFESLSDQALQSQELLRLGAAIYEKSGMLPEAIRALEAALKLDVNNLGLRNDWIRLRLRSNDEKRVRTWIKKAPLDLKGDAEDRLEFAQLLDMYGRRPEALEIAYAALRDNWGNSERLHLMYASLFLMHERVDSFLKTKVVADNVVVFLEDAQGKRTKFRIEAAATPSVSVLSPDHPFAKRLIGKQVGETIVAPAGIGSAEPRKIVEIKHKYLDLLHEALENHDTTFPGSRALGRFKVDVSSTDGLEPLFEQARERARIVDRLIDVYREHPVPVDFIAKALGSNPIDVSRGLRFESQIALENCQGGEPERNQAILQIRGAERVLLDPITLSIWQETGILDASQAVSSFRVCVVQATLDLLNDRLDDARRNSKSTGGTLSAKGDQLVFMEHSKADLDAYTERCADLVTWCREHAEIVPTEPLENGEFATEALSHASIDTIATAITGHIPAVIEDRRLRLFAASLGADYLSWSQPLLMTWHTDGQIDTSTYARLIAALQLAKCSFISVSSSDLTELAKGDATRTEFEMLVTALTRPTVEPVSMIHVATAFILGLWRDPGEKFRRDRLVSAVLEGTLSRPDGLDMLRSILGSVWDGISKFPYPEHLISNWWIEYFERFCRGHFIYEKLTGNRNQR